MGEANEAADRLRGDVETATRLLLGLGDSVSELRPAPGKWSPREILGHLVDSVMVNHDRVVRAQFQDDLVFPGHDQDRWVASQRYQEASWPALVMLWGALNRELARVMEAVPVDLRARPRERHNLHEIGWKKVPPGEPATLDDLLRDYVGHLEHHLAQILGPGWRVG